MSMRRPRTAEEMQREAEALSNAAGVAFAEGDIQHADDLKRRAQFMRRAARERAAGVSGCPTGAFKE